MVSQTTVEGIAVTLQSPKSRPNKQFANTMKSQKHRPQRNLMQKYGNCNTINCKGKNMVTNDTVDVRIINITEY